MSERLVALLYAGTFVEVKKALERGADPNKLFESTPPLHVAAKKRRLDCIELLIKHGANVDRTEYHGCTALYSVFEEKSTCVLLACLQRAFCASEP